MPEAICHVRPRFNFRSTSSASLRPSTLIWVPPEIVEVVEGGNISRLLERKTEGHMRS